MRTVGPASTLHHHSAVFRVLAMGNIWRAQAESLLQLNEIFDVLVEVDALPRVLRLYNDVLELLRRMLHGETLLARFVRGGGTTT